LSGVFDIEVTSEGRIYVSEPTLGEITVFDRDGTYAGTVGRWGEGPGEFKNPGAVRFKGDTLTVLEFGTGINLLSSEGEFYDRFIVRFPPSSPGTLASSSVALLADGSVACFSPSFTSPVVSGQVTHETWLRASRAGELLDTLIVQPLAGRYASVELPGGNQPSFGHPAAWSDLMAIRPDGSELLAVDRSAAEAGPGPVVLLFRINLAGDTIQIRQMPYEPVPLSSEWIDSLAMDFGKRRADQSNVPADRLASEYRNQVQWPDHHPAVSSVIVAPDGTVWLRREAVSPDSVRWDLLDPTLDPAGFTFLPTSLDVKRVSATSAWGVELDEWDIPWIVRFDLHGSG
jgi:hypothetical protein